MGSLLSKMDPTSISTTFLGKRTTESKMSTETEKCDNQGKWPELPPFPLGKIYSFLGRADQTNMSQVCHNWSEAYSSPSVWETFRFTLTKSQLSMDTCPEIKFARKYSGMFKHVEITYVRLEKRDLFVQWCRVLKEFLQILTTNSQLTSVRFYHLRCLLHELDTAMYEDVFKAIVDFLKSQRRLKRVEFEMCSFGFQEGVELIKAMTENSRESITHLMLLFFLDESIHLAQDSIIAQSLPTLINQRFPRLKSLVIDYSLIFENMFAHQSGALDALKNCQMRELSKIILSCYGFKHAILRGLTSATWRSLKQSFPNLALEFVFITNTQSQREIEFFFVPDMPITELHYSFEVCEVEHSPCMEMDALLNHFLACRINESLICFCLEGTQSIPNLAIFIPFTQACKKLKRLYLHVLYPASGIDLMARSWLENNPASLEEVSISIWDVENKDISRSLMNAANQYAPLLKSVGINLKVDLHD